MIYLLVMWQIQEYEDRYGLGRKPRVMIRTAAYRWKESGVDTLEAAEAYLKKLEYYRSQEGELLAAVGITGRKAAAGERKYLAAWTEMGFPPETVALACDRTITNTGAMKWAYCNAILKRWHREGLHTPEEVAVQQQPRRAAGGPRPRRVPGPGSRPPDRRVHAEKEREILENERWMREFLKQQESS